MVAAPRSTIIAERSQYRAEAEPTEEGGVTRVRLSRQAKGAYCGWRGGVMWSWAARSVAHGPSGALGHRSDIYQVPYLEMGQMSGIKNMAIKKLNP